MILMVTSFHWPNLRIALSRQLTSIILPETSLCHSHVIIFTALIKKRDCLLVLDVGGCRRRLIQEESNHVTKADFLVTLNNRRI